MDDDSEDSEDPPAITEPDQNPVLANTINEFHSIFSSLTRSTALTRDDRQITANLLRIFELQEQELEGTNSAENAHATAGDEERTTSDVPEIDSRINVVKKEKKKKNRTKVLVEHDP